MCVCVLCGACVCVCVWCMCVCVWCMCVCVCVCVVCVCARTSVALCMYISSWNLCEIAQVKDQDSARYTVYLVLARYHLSTITADRAEDRCTLYGMLCSISQIPLKHHYC